ncbi:hypothetical protein [Saccharolobus islandicus]|uniref:Ssol-1539-like N-teminal second subdomain domain-containing protein n=1 Tax=Saccharolobus islandicus (strain L.D.8.5 / Lassen \|nr:hypothetical protein [Sulfolobus islandicus]ADB87809.1 hypothetical protein LD85_2158 [Sulfolobus islandicus L.D.8.5]
MKQIKEEIGAKEVSDSDIQEYSLISTIPYLRQLVDEGKISVRTAYELYKKAKDKLQKITSLPKYERDQLLTTKEGRKILLERDDLLQLILDHKMAVSQAINKIKTEEKLKKTKGSKPRAKEEEENENEDEGEKVETIDREDSESDEYPFVEEWAQAQKEEEDKQQLTPQFNVNEINNDLESYLKQLVTEGFVELDKTKLYLVTLDGKTYLINARAVNELKSGKGVGKYKKLEEFIQSKGLGFYDPEEGAYSISFQLLA